MSKSQVQSAKDQLFQYSYHINRSQFSQHKLTIWLKVSRLINASSFLNMKGILIIEDDDNVRESLIELLKTRNYNVVAAENGAKGLMLAQENKPSLIVCDVMMPGISGFDVVESIRKDANLSHIPFIFLSAKANQSDMDYGIKMGANFYMTKPFKVRDLFSTIENLL